ncbi:MAG: 30S ribosomal protein S20 [Dehalococcoidia bacterium]|jgi:small subunit ribosomal protein S20
MAHHKSAIKRWHQSLRERDRNRARRTLARGSVRRLREAVAAGDDAKVKEALSEAYSTLDRAAKMGAIHTGKADRAKRRLAALTSKPA